VTLDDHRPELTRGARFRYTTFFAPFKNRAGETITNRERGSRFSTWEVLRVESRGVVIGHPMDGKHGTAGGHQHLAEWTMQLGFFELVAFGELPSSGYDHLEEPGFEHLEGA
jgi:hypothetical protein